MLATTTRMVKAGDLVEVPDLPCPICRQRGTTLRVKGVE
jgi:hypothetical protein